MEKSFSLKQSYPQVTRAATIQTNGAHMFPLCGDSRNIERKQMRQSERCLSEEYRPLRRFCSFRSRFIVSSRQHVSCNFSLWTISPLEGLCQTTIFVSCRQGVDICYLQFEDFSFFTLTNAVGIKVAKNLSFTETINHLCKR